MAFNSFFSNSPVSRKEAFFHLHFAVFLFGFTAILGNLVSIPGISTVFFRMLITVAVFSFFPGVLKKTLSLSWIQILHLGTIGFLLALHWALFFGAIKASNVSVTLCCIATASFFTAIFEPLFTKKRFQWHELFLGLMVVPGIYLIYKFSGTPVLGIALGIGAAIFGSLFSVLNKAWVVDMDPVLVTFAELSIGLTSFLPFVPLYYFYFPDEIFIPTGYDWLWLGILSLLCTCIAYISSLKALKVLTTFTVALTINLEPVYGIIMAIILFHEHQEMGWGFYFGALLVVGSVFIHPLIDSKLARKQ